MKIFNKFKGNKDTEQSNLVPAAFRRLCVETLKPFILLGLTMPAAFRRLCVETICVYAAVKLGLSSRLQAAVC